MLNIIVFYPIIFINPLVFNEFRINQVHLHRYTHIHFFSNPPQHTSTLFTGDVRDDLLVQVVDPNILGLMFWHCCCLIMQKEKKNI